MEKNNTIEWIKFFIKYPIFLFQEFIYIQIENIKKKFKNRK